LASKRQAATRKVFVDESAAIFIGNGAFARFFGQQA
jgi:hypothetical protein